MSFSYTVQAGDTLSALALAVFGDPSRWPEIHQANCDVLGSNPNLIFPGQVLLLPNEPVDMARARKLVSSPYAKIIFNDSKKATQR